MSNQRVATQRKPFPRTRWSVVAGLNSADRNPEALAELCSAYWIPIYGFIRNAGKSREDAQDLTQGFFARVLKCNLFSVADQDRGKMRTFLLGTLKNFLCDEHDKATAVKRGGATELVPMDFEDAENLFTLASEGPSDPSRQYDQQWALALLTRVLDELRVEYDENGRRHLFEKLHPVLTDQSLDKGYAEIAAELDVSTNAVTIAVYRLRQRYRELLCSRIADTVESPEEVEGEIAYLCGLFGEPER